MNRPFHRHSDLPPLPLRHRIQKTRHLHNWNVPERLHPQQVFERGHDIRADSSALRKFLQCAVEHASTTSCPPVTRRRKASGTCLTKAVPCGAGLFRDRLFAPWEVAKSWPACGACAKILVRSMEPSKWQLNSQAQSYKQQLTALKPRRKTLTP